MEEWKDIEDYEGLYQVSSEGRVKSLKFGKEKILRYTKANKGYAQLTLSKNSIQTTYKIHRLVAEAFIPNPDNKPQIDHINTDRTDNRVENLRWVTPKENCNNSITIENYSKCKLGLLNHNTKPILQFTKDGEFVKKWDSMSEIEKELGFNHSHLTSCCRQKKKSAYGYVWMYANIGVFEIDINKLKKVA